MGLGRTRYIARAATLGVGIALSFPLGAQGAQEEASPPTRPTAANGPGAPATAAAPDEAPAARPGGNASRRASAPRAVDERSDSEETEPGAGPKAEVTEEGKPPAEQDGAEHATAHPSDSGSEIDDYAAPPVERSGPAPLSLTISGGASLGAHEAGYLYYLTEALKLNPNRFNLVMATGASAGSINALLSIIESCRPSPKTPRDSLFYQSWTDLGLDDLFIPTETTSLGAFSRRAFQRVVARIRKAFDGGLYETCDAVLAVTVTRVQPVQVPVKPGVLSLPRTEEKFVVRIQGQGLGKPPKASNYVDASFTIPQPMLPFDDGGSDFPPISQLAIASAAFPLAFAPVKLAHCTTQPGRGPAQRCTEKNARHDAFIDGGVFDNTPLGLAVRTAMAGMRRSASGASGWVDAPNLRDRRLDQDLQFAYVDPGMTAYPVLPPEEGDELPGSVLEFTLDLAGRFINEARTRELRSVAETFPDIGDHLTVTPSFHPLISEPLHGFFGFIEHAFRNFDFYQGMYDAERFIRALAKRNGRQDDVRLPDTDPQNPAWAPFLCLKGVYDGRPDLAKACASPSLRDFRILLQVTLNRLYSHCHAVAKLGKPPRTRHPGCRDAMAGKPPPRVLGAAAFDHSPWERGENEADLDYILRLLAKYRFRFRDLGLARRQADLGKRTIRLKLGEIATALARAQKTDRVLVDVAAKTALNALSYAPPRNIFYGTIGHAIELGYSGTNPAGRTNWLRGTAGIGFNGWQQFVTSQGGNFAMTFMAGPEFEVTPLSSAAIQARVSARAGLILSAEDGMFSSPCEEASVSRPCSGLITDVALTLSVFEVARLQFLVQVFPQIGRQQETFVELRPAFGVQFADPF